MTMLRAGAPLPNPPFPILPLRSGVLFPGTMLALNVGRARSVALLNALDVGDVLAVVTQKNSSELEPEIDGVHRVGSFAKIVKIAPQSDRSFRLVLEGLDRFELERLDETDPFWRGRGALIDSSGANDPEAAPLAQALHQRVTEVVEQNGGALSEVPPLGDDLGLFADRVSAALPLDSDAALGLLETRDVVARLRRVLELLAQAKALAEIRTKIDKDVRETFGKRQRDAILREQLEAIRRELGDGGDDQADSLKKKLDQAELPEEIRKIADREQKRLDASGGQGPEANVIRTYLEWLGDLPWSKRATVHDDLDRVAHKLDDDHYGLEDVKQRILEHLAVHKLSGNPRGTILCLVGPPGVGKTSLGQSIADATGRPFVRISLGGVRDEAEIRGHRRTYVGALPGRIVHGLRKAGVKNPVMLLDEVDKLAAGWGGSPEAALLEVLDPEQNKSFTDHYLEAPFDLSEVMFVCTANTLDTISAPLRDRLEIVELSGYTETEKLQIARRHLIPKRLEDNGIPDGALSLTDGALSEIICSFTREAGVRQLDREITRLCRAVALEVARKTDDARLEITIDPEKLRGYLGKPRFQSEVAERTAFPGVATGLAWTPFGGDILFIETSRMPGKGKLEITGQLGDVMKESARAALSYVRSHAGELEIDPSLIDASDLHLHVPAGAVPKDGPSAGVTIFTALSSLLSGRRVRSDTAMTGEVTLRGRVLPVGGIKAKLLAAHRAGIRRVVLPSKNERDVDDVPAETRAELEILFVTDMSDVLRATLEDVPAPLSASFGDAPRTDLPRVSVLSASHS
jgi:ATP-dependent Lon protease